MIERANRLKSRVKAHWEDETCGTRYADAVDRQVYFQDISDTRYQLEPYILQFADFASAKGKQVLEIGVGAGADFLNWCQHAKHATGIDLTEAAIRLTDERLCLNGIPAERYTLQTSDAENLPFEANSFDILYSWGVLHHTPDTYRAFQEAFRVLRPGGTMKVMIYHVPSWVGLMLYLRYAVPHGKWRMSMKDVIFDHLESPGTKAYSVQEARKLLTEIGFSDLNLFPKLGPGDLLMIKPSRKYASAFYTLIWRCYPRWLVRRLGDKYGLSLLITATKSAA